MLANLMKGLLTKVWVSQGSYEDSGIPSDFQQPGTSLPQGLTQQEEGALSELEEDVCREDPRRARPSTSRSHQPTAFPWGRYQGIRCIDWLSPTLLLALPIAWTQVEARGCHYGSASWGNAVMWGEWRVAWSDNQKTPCRSRIHNRPRGRNRLTGLGTV